MTDSQTDLLRARVRKLGGGRGPTGRANVYELPDFSAALERMRKRAPTSPELAAQTAAASFETAAMRLSTGGETHPPAGETIRRDKPKQSVVPIQSGVNKEQKQGNQLDINVVSGRIRGGEPVALGELLANLRDRLTAAVS